MIHLKEYNSFRDLKEFEPIWNTLLQESKDNDIFSTWEWISCWWKHLGKHRELRVLTAEEGNKIWAIAPFMLSKYRFMKFATISKIEFLGSPQSDYNNFIWIGHEQRCLDLFLKHLLQQPDWDCLDLTDVREGTLSARLLRESPAATSSKLESRVVATCPYMKLPPSLEEFAKSMDRDMRHSLRRKMRRLSEKHGINFKTHSDFASVQDATSFLFDLNEKRWSPRGESGAFARQEVRDFHRDLVNRFSEKGWLAMSFLTANEEPIAVDYSFDYRAKRYGYQSGFDPRFARYGVGELLRMHNIEVCLARGLREYDFLRGGERYKLRWPTKIRRNFAIELVRKGLLARTRRHMIKTLPQDLLKKLRQKMALEEMEKTTE
jgi:CelD/BcsL family acetyltransferase involved in cellulose biosynthesis